MGDLLGVLFAAGQLYVADQWDDDVRRVDTRTGTLTTVTGQGPSGFGNGFGGDGGPAAAAELNRPDWLAMDPSGDLIIIDSGNYRVRLVAKATGTLYGQSMTAGDIYTVAGDGQDGYSGDGGPAPAAGIVPSGVTVDGSGNLVVGDVSGRIRVVAARSGTFYGQTMAAGDIYTVAGNGTDHYSGDGGPAVNAGFEPLSLVVDRHGNLVMSDVSGDRIRVIAVASGTFYGQHMIAGDIYTVAGDGQSRASGDGGPAVRAGLNPVSLAVDRSGNVLASDGGLYDERIRLVAETTGRFYGLNVRAGDIYTVVNGATTHEPSIGGPAGVAVDGAGNLVFADGNSQVVALAARSGTFYGMAMSAGHLYRVAGNGRVGYSGDGGPPPAAELQNPRGVAVDRQDDIAIADAGNEVIRLIPTSSGRLFGQAMQASDIYSVAGNDSGVYPSGDGGPAIDAHVSPDSVAFDHAGNLIIPNDWNREVEVVAAHTGHFYGQAMTEGYIYKVAGGGRYQFCGDGGPATKACVGALDVAVDRAGNLVLADPRNNRVRVVAVSNGTFYGRQMTSGDIYTVAGSGQLLYSGDGMPALSAAVNPGSIAVDNAGNLVISDFANSRIRVVAVSTGTYYGQAMVAHDIYTVAGTGQGGPSGDGGPAIDANVLPPYQLRVDHAGNLLLPSNIGHVRVVAVTPGTFYAVPMVAGDIYTVAGEGPCCFSGDGGPAIDAGLFIPWGVGVDPAGDLIIVDIGENRLRLVTG